MGEAGVGRRMIWTEMWVQIKPWQSHGCGFPGGSVGKTPLPIQELWVRSLGQEDPLGKKMATHSNILAWEIPWTEEPDGLQSMGSQKRT